MDACRERQRAGLGHTSTERHGVPTRAELSEAILHTAIYAGVPAVNSAMAVARDTFAAIDAEAGTPASRP